MKARWEYEPRTEEWVLALWASDGVPQSVYGTMSAGSLTAVSIGARQTVAEAIQQQHGMMPPARVFDGPPGEQVTMTCGLCWTVSFMPADVEKRYCGICRTFPEVDEDVAASRPAATA